MFFKRSGVIFRFLRGETGFFSSFSIANILFSLDFYISGMLNNKIEFTSINRINNYGLDQ